MLVKKPYHQTDSSNCKYWEAKIDQNDRARNIFKAERQGNSDDGDNRTQNGGLDDIDQVGKACETPHAPVAIKVIQAGGFC